MQIAARSPSVLQNPRPSLAPPGGTRAIAPQVLAPRLTQPQQATPNIQNIQLPPGMVLVRSESGQLLVIHQQTLAQMQAQSQSQSAMTPRAAAPTSTPPVQIASLQAPGASPLARPVAPTAIIKQGSAVQATVTPTTTLQRPPILQVTLMCLNRVHTQPGKEPLGTPTPVQAGPAATQRATGTPVTPTAVTAVRRAPFVCMCLQETLENVKKCRNFLSTLIKLASSGKQSSETIANVKELVKNLLEAKIEPEDFTSRLYRELNSSPQPYLVPFLKRSLPALRQMTPDSESFIQQSLLPQPAAATSTALTAVVLRPPVSTASSSPAATKTTVISLTQTPPSKPALVILCCGSASHSSASDCAQQHGTLVRPQVALAQSPMGTLRGQPHSRIVVSHPQVVKQQPTGVSLCLLYKVNLTDFCLCASVTHPAMKQTLAQGAKGLQVVSQASLIAAQRNKLKEAGGGTFRSVTRSEKLHSAVLNVMQGYKSPWSLCIVHEGESPAVIKQRVLPAAGLLNLNVSHTKRCKLCHCVLSRDDDDINDVASMAGVNLSEESDRILATNSELVGAVTRSCKDEAFLSTALLARRALEIGRKFGVSELGPDAANFIAHATQQRLRHLLERVSLVAQHRNGTFKEDERCEQASDVRTQLRFFEQLDKAAKVRILAQRHMTSSAAGSRSRQEDPEQLRLKQKAKEMQQQELAQIRQREANLTALAAIGPRKKRKMDSPVRGASAEPGGSGGSGSRQFTRQRITRVNLRDLLFCLENERGTSRSHLLYRGFLK
uniref:TATA-box binding protein associated factor 4 n=1 Tax=Gasterosteus aculeatus TaxID=69293 RepID=G3PQM3_GASAC